MRRTFDRTLNLILTDVKSTPCLLFQWDDRVRPDETRDTRDHKQTTRKIGTKVGDAKATTRYLSSAIGYREER